jgi:hypothetical protein
MCNGILKADEEKKTEKLFVFFNHRPSTEP